MNKSDSIAALSAALTKAQKVIVPPIKDAANPFFKSKYADLNSVWEACRSPLSANGLAVMQLPGKDEFGVYVSTVLSHDSGEWIESRTYMTPAQDTPQGIGSLITYARRYGLQAMVGIAPEDDDGNAASGTDEVTARQYSREERARSVGREQPRSDEGELKQSDWWRSVVIHFGIHKDKMLGDLEPKSLAWFKRWEPKPFNGRMNPKDLALKEAVDAITKEEPDEIQMFGPNVKNLRSQLEFAGVTEDQFLGAMKAAGHVPEVAKSMNGMTEETALRFSEDFENTLALCKAHAAKQGDKTEKLPFWT